jgi:pimeloyl-ACP methyl ester carboxylesterase
VTYDPRGYTRSHLDGEPAEQRVEVHGEHDLLAEVTSEPAYVFGTSGGALVGTELAIRHPEQVRVLVAHEPAAIDALPDGAEWRKFFDHVVDTFHNEGPFPAVAKCVKITSVDPEEQPERSEPTPESMAAMEQMTKNFELFFEYQLQQFAHGVPDVDALKAAPTRVVWAGGSGSRGLPCYEAGAILAERYEAPLIEFPGDHQGVMTYPGDFAKSLEAAIAGN